MLNGECMQSKKFVRINILFAFYIVLMPIFSVLLGCIGVDFSIGNQLFFWTIFFMVFLFVCLLINAYKRKKIGINLKNKYFGLTMALLLWISISSIVNRNFSIDLLFYISYFCIFVCFYKLDKKFFNLLLNILIGCMVVSCVLGFVDPYNRFMPGFNFNAAPMSLQFSTSNYAAYIVAALTILCFIRYEFQSKRLLSFFYGISYLVFCFYLFMNGSFIAITSVLMLEIFSVIFLSIKHKKFQCKMLMLFIVAIAICFLVELVPNIENIRSCRYNYFLECVAVMDNVLHTNFLAMFNISEVPGADGWSRSEYAQDSLSKCTGSVKSIIFGDGAGTFSDYKPHNAFLSLFLDFGIVLPILFGVLIFFVYKEAFKFKRETLSNQLVYVITSFLLCYMFGSIVYNSFYVYIILMAGVFNFKSKKEVN